MKEKMLKLKRFLAKYGVGNPLNQLIYSSKEIQEMKNRGEILENPPARKYKFTAWRKRKENLGKWAIQINKLVVEKKFDNKQEAEKWANWNYKGRGGYKVILLF